MITVEDRERRDGQKAALEVIASFNSFQAKPDAVQAALMALLEDAGLKPVPTEIANRIEGFAIALHRELAMKAAG